MRALRKYGWVGAAVALAVACSDDTGPSEDELVGTWNATKLEFVAPGVAVDAIAFGATMQLVLGSNGTYTVTLGFPGEGTETETGTWSASEDVLTLSGSDGDMQFDMSLSGNTLTLTGADGEFDVDDDGVDDPVTVNVTLVKQ
ncbi:MAG: hypothetical protein H6R40_1593 [Gemmatimonadetes bacterium]|nr:hypothetical protein [Gemmatimonadota bacterium]